MSKFTDEQISAINAQGKTIVSASAGSGKTTVMIEKMIRLIRDEGVDVKDILAVTYTKKAAASMKEKLRKALVKAMNDPATSKENRERLKAQHRQVALADISTIHSFCAKLIRTHFYATDVGNRFGIIAEDDADGTTLKNRAVENVFEQAYAEGNEDFKKLLSVFFRKKKDDTLRKVILETHSKVRTHVGYREELLASGQDSDELFDEICKECFSWYVDKCKYYREQLSTLYATFEKYGRADLAKHCGILMDVLNPECIVIGRVFARNKAERHLRGGDVRVQRDAVCFRYTRILYRSGPVRKFRLRGYCVGRSRKNGGIYRTSARFFRSDLVQPARRRAGGAPYDGGIRHFRRSVGA